MDNIDITTALGIAGFVGIFMQFIKYLLKSLSDAWKGLITIFIVAILCIFISFVVYWIGFGKEGETIQNVVIRGFQSIFIAIGGYEGIKQVMQLFVEKKE